MSWLRRQTNYSGGISAGGGDTGWDSFPQPTLFMKRVGGIAARATLPKGTVLLALVLVPDADNPPTDGKVDVENVATSALYGSDVDVTVASEAELPSPEQLPEDTEFLFTPDSGVDGLFYVGFLCIPPRTPR